MKVMNISFKNNFFIYDFLIIFYLFLGYLIGFIYGFNLFIWRNVFYSKYDFSAILVILLYLLIHISITAFYCLKRGDDLHLFGAVWRKKVGRDFFNLTSFFKIIKVLFLLKLTLIIYCNLKQQIPIIHSSLWDKELLRVDHFFHFGYNPSLIAIKYLGNDIICWFFDIFYALWYIIKFPIIIYFLITPSKKVHIRFFITYFSMWIFGGLFALLFPSLGPIYTHPDWFSHLNKPIASFLQGELMKNYELFVHSPGKYRIVSYEGIAAFPSLHVGIIAVFAISLFKVNRLLSYLMFIYLIIIQVGSVLLGWHYAIDGYFAIILAVSLYYFSAFFVEKKKSDNKK